MRSISLVILLTACAAHEQKTAPVEQVAWTPAASCKPKAPFRLYFDRIEVIKLSQLLSELTCKPVVIGPNVEQATVSIITPETRSDFSGEEAFKVITVAAELDGVSILDKDGVIRITRIKK